MAGLAVDACALTICIPASVALVPVEVLDVGLLLFVRALSRCVRVVALRIVILPLLLLWFVYPRREHIIFDCFTSPACDYRNLEPRVEGAILLVEL